MKAHEFTYPSKLESEGKMLKDLHALLKDYGVPTFTKHNIMVVICEAFNNALLHGNKLDPKKRIKLVISINKKVLHADIIDEGRGGLEKIKKREPSQTWAESGRGINIIGYYVNSVHFEETDKGGLKVSMKFSLNEKKMMSEC